MSEYQYRRKSASKQNFSLNSLPPDVCGIKLQPHLSPSELFNIVDSRKTGTNGGASKRTELATRGELVLGFLLLLFAPILDFFFVEDLSACTRNFGEQYLLKSGSDVWIGKSHSFCYNSGSDRAITDIPTHGLITLQTDISAYSKLKQSRLLRKSSNIHWTAEPYVLSLSQSPLSRQSTSESLKATTLSASLP